MKHRNFVKNSIVALLPISLGIGLLFGINIKPVAEKVDGYTAASLPTTIDLNDCSESDIRSYYSSLNSLTTSQRQGTNLLKNLKTILKNGQQYYSYENGTSIWQMYEITDRDWDKSPASSTTYGTYNSSTNKITNYTYGTSASSSKNNPYIHALYINRNVDNKTTAWDNHNQDQWGINREHVWPKAEGFDTEGAGGARGDPMHLMAGNGYANNIHSNNYYGYVNTSTTYTNCGSKYPNQSGNLRGISKTLGGTTNVFEPQDSDKGDIARAIFYMVARYNYLSGSDSDGINTNNPNLTLTQSLDDWKSSGYTSTTSNPGKMGIMTDLLAWHKADPVDQYEIHRNNLLYKNFTKNRNPFIDFPEWADAIWGTVSYSGSTMNSYDSTIRKYATPSSDRINGYNSSGGQTVSVTEVSLNKNSTSIEAGSDETLTATVAPSNATNQTVTWSTSNANIATVSGGIVHGVAEGSATITVTTSDGGFEATCSVTVSASQGGGGSGGDTKQDKIIAKGFGGYTGSSYGEAGTDYTGVANLTNSSGSTYALQVFIGSSGQVRGNKSGSANFSARNTTTYANYYISEVSLTVNADGTIDGSDSTRSLVYFGTSAYANPSTAPSGTATRASPASAGQQTLTWSNTDTAKNYFILYNLKASSNPKCEDSDSPLVVTWTKIPTKTLSSITIDTQDVNKTFYVGDEFEYGGLSVTANYNDKTSELVNGYTVSGVDTSTPGQQTVTVSYTENNVTKTATYSITVKYPGSSETSQMVVSNSSSSYFENGAIWLSGNTTEVSTSCDAFTLTKRKIGNYDIDNTNDEVLVKSMQRITITPNTGYKITTAVFVGKDTNSANALGGNARSNCTKKTSGVYVTITPENTSNAFYLTNSGTSYINYIVVNFTHETLMWESPDIDVFSGSTLTGADVNSWSVSDGTSVYTYSQLSIYLNNIEISIPYTWKAEDNGKVLKAGRNGIYTTESEPVVITQTINNVLYSGSETYDYEFPSKQFNSAGSVELSGHTWTQAGTGDGFWGYDSTKGQQFGKAAAPYSSLTLTCTDFEGVIDSVVVYTSGAKDISANVQVSVGGTNYANSAKSITNTNTAYTFNKGGKSGTIVITWSQTSSKAIYLKEIVVNNTLTNKNIANSPSHKVAQRIAVNFANAFNSAMDETNYCTTNLDSAWTTCTNAYNDFISQATALGSVEEKWAKNLIKFATAQYTNDNGEACIERMMKTYEVCVQKHNKSPFMNDIVTVGSTSSLNYSFAIDQNKAVIFVIIISVLSIGIIGGYFFIKSRRKEEC